MLPSAELHNTVSRITSTRLLLVRIRSQQGPFGIRFSPRANAWWSSEVQREYRYRSSLRMYTKAYDDFDDRQGRRGELTISRMKWSSEISQISPKMHPCRESVTAFQIWAKLIMRCECSIRELAQPSTKASVTHTFTRDTRDDPWMGSAGSLLKISHVNRLFTAL